jgi:SlyX protein
MNDLESRLAFLDDTVEQLNTVVVRQAQEISLLQQQLTELASRMEDLGGASPEEADGQQYEIPPHY